jgi:predicted nucleic acid-binding protein
MAAYIFDTSGIVKRYVTETGTAWVQALAAPSAGHVVYLARIGAVELVSAVTRRQRGGSLTAAATAAIIIQFRQDLGLEYRVIEITPGLLSDAMLVAEQHTLRAYDAVHLAAASELRRQRLAAGLGPVTLVSADQELLAAAGAVGLQVEDPNLHP